MDLTEVSFDPFIIWNMQILVLNIVTITFALMGLYPYISLQ